MPDFIPLPFPELQTSDPAIDRAYRIAMGDLTGNVRMFQDGLLDKPQPVLLAGLDYDTPWTRDASINVWNGLALFWPGVARNTLLSVLERRDDRLYIGGQYWDAMIWAVGSWTYYLHTGDHEFLSLAYDAVKNSLVHFEREEFDEQLGLFRGPAVYGDGVAAYPDRYSPGGTSSILDCVKANLGEKSLRGYGIPMKSLSTNCIYARAYRIAAWMAHECGDIAGGMFEECSERLAARIRENFWNVELGTFNYLIDDEGICDYQEGLGHAFAILFHIGTDEQSASVFVRQQITPFGIPCVWPTFARYSALGGFGRHSGTVWPFISGFWGEAALQQGRADLFEHEFVALTGNINRSGQCAEIHHPETGETYGGLQEGGSGSDGMEWVSCMRQSWSASAYLRMILTGLLGLRFSTDGIGFSPHFPPGIEGVQICGLRYGDCVLDVFVEGHGTKISEIRCNGMHTSPFLPAGLQGEQRIQIRLTG